jgi:hypothetical protein
MEQYKRLDKAIFSLANAKKELEVEMGHGDVNCGQSRCIEEMELAVRGCRHGTDQQSATKQLSKLARDWINQMDNHWRLDSLMKLQGRR